MLKKGDLVLCSHFLYSKQVATFMTFEGDFMKKLMGELLTPFTLEEVEMHDLRVVFRKDITRPGGNLLKGILVGTSSIRAGKIIYHQEDEAAEFVLTKVFRCWMVIPVDTKAYRKPIPVLAKDIVGSSYAVWNEDLLFNTAVTRILDQEEK